MREFLIRLGPHDCVVLIGDIRQHQGIEAGRPFEQLQEARMRTAKLDEIVRQKDPALKSALESLATGQTAAAPSLYGQSMCMRIRLSGGPASYASPQAMTFNEIQPACLRVSEAAGRNEKPTAPISHYRWAVDVRAFGPERSRETPGSFAIQCLAQEEVLKLTMYALGKVEKGSNSTASLWQYHPQKALNESSRRRLLTTYAQISEPRYLSFNRHRGAERTSASIF